MHRALASVFLLLSLTSCATASLQLGHPEVADLASARTGIAIDPQTLAQGDAALRDRVRALLHEPLTPTSAVAVALLNNPELRQKYAGFGIAQADLAQAGLLHNPSLGASVRFPDKALPIDVEVSLVADLLDVFVRPMRRDLAEMEFAQARLTLAHAMAATGVQVREAVYAVQAGQQRVALRTLVVEAALTGAELADRQHAAGNTSDLDHETQRVAAEEARLELTREQAELTGQREHLTRLLGLAGPQIDWQIVAPLADLPARDGSLEGLQARATQRLDALAAAQEVAVLARARDLATTLRFVGTVQVGVSHERSPEGYRVTGPTLALDLPIFDRRQALLARLQAQELQARRRHAGLVLEAQSQVRVALAEVKAQRQQVELYRKVLIPGRERIVAEAQRHYNAMLLGVFQLLQTRQAEIQTYRDYIEAVRGYWAARAHLESAVGGPVELAVHAEEER